MKKAFLFFAGMIVAVLLYAQPAQNKAKQKPNIIYIYADDMGYGELGCYGQQKIKTPNLDKLAGEGIRFTQHYTSTPVCAPARNMLLTGKHGGHAYIRGNYELGGFEDEKEGGQMPLPEGTFTIAHLMKKAGYTTGLVGKWGLGMNNTTGAPDKQGFDYYYGYLCQKQAHNFYPTHLWENGKRDTLRNTYFYVHRPVPKNSADSVFDNFKGQDYAVTKMAEKTLAFIRNNKNKPFFLYLPYTAPHVSLQAPDEAVKEYIGQFDEQPYYGEKGYAPTKYPLSTYAAMITYMDKQIGRIMDLLKELKLDENTIVMFSSDNGSTFNVGGVDVDYFNLTGGLRGRKQELYEGGIREPFIARWPGKIPGGKVTGHVSAQFDMMATLSELTGIKAPPNDGISFLPTLLGKDEQQQKHPFLYFEFPEKSGQVAVRIGDWKGVKSNMKTNKNAPWEIYNLDTDEKETNDVAAQHPELVKRFEAILQEQHQPSHIREWEFINPKFSVQK
ncbi:MAG: arylsulfatase [Terrimonas sp.]|nr:arylsulfatase [Terrimonas sp.]OJY81273.1 MAG: N-acetylgalactosamine-6-sulfatase [Sphingobacteriales bacterium 40-81]